MLKLFFRNARNTISVLIYFTFLFAGNQPVSINAQTPGFAYFTAVYLPDGICADKSGNVYTTSVNPDNVFQEFLTKYSPSAERIDQIVLEHTGRLEYDSGGGMIWMIANQQVCQIDPVDLTVTKVIDLASLEISTDQIYDIATGMPFPSSIVPNSAFYGDFTLVRQDNQITLFIAGFYQAWHFILRVKMVSESVESAAVIVTSGATLSPEDNTPHGVAVNSNGTVMTTLGKAGAAANTDQPVTFRVDYPENSDQPPAYLFDEYQNFTSAGIAVDQYDNFYVATGWVGGGTAGGGNSCLIVIPPELDTTYAYPMGSIYANPRDVCVDRKSGLIYYTDSDMDFFSDQDAIWTFTPITRIDSESIRPERFSLEQNYPNPFNSITWIPFMLPASAYVRISIYDLRGREIAKLLNKYLSAGQYRIPWSSANLPSGIYFYQIRAGTFRASRTMSLIK